MAFPHGVLANKPGLLDEVVSICQREEVGAVVMGKSLDRNGKPNPIMDAVHVFLKDLKASAKLPVYFEPEFYTSVQARALQGRNDMIDASAATIILQSYLDRQNAGTIDKIDE
jgi:RNase H-fold protein (predicted Holliday junction resolvase)